MSVLIHAEIHGLGGRASELRALLGEHATGLAGAPGNLGASAYEPVGGEVGEFVLQARWRDDNALRAHYATPEYTHYVESIGALLARPSDVQIHYVERSVRATADLSLDPTRQG
ncbi:MAG TPA: antibiotic biosynthesis monooxygenase [Baekduia sp.]|uniref:putative quinol monooxygenase n=1 Tax=Baekduia sp. TaxID=2600305 RepID=UPI002C50569C|nr:antibiotic biosynthesis monooxygenase [Baekduia sp.]HMJ32842.1 antibiotic biosynthesis monooxygenase [Baekduia sp.]